MNKYRFKFTVIVNKYRRILKNTSELPLLHLPGEIKQRNTQFLCGISVQRSAMIAIIVQPFN
jgi:hypothetical protein